MSGKGKIVEKPGTAVATQQTGEVVPEYAKKAAGSGSRLQADAEDFVVPRAKLLHGTSTEPQMFTEAKIGQFWVNVLDKDLGAELDFIVCRNRKRVLLMRPMDDKTGEPILARAEDGKTWDRKGTWKVKLKGRSKPDVDWTIDELDVRASGLLEFGTSDPKDGDSNPAATVFHDYLIFMPQHPEVGPVLFSMARTAAKRAKALNSKIEMRSEASGVDMQALKFKAVVTSEEKDSQKYFNIDFKNNGFATEAELTRCLQIAERFKNFKGAGEEDTGEAETTAKGATVERTASSEV